ncbi:CLUMA_CG013531, isoform A [Clunio marinus]|uniref:CLUMA_CG013526, isoform A n=1 Tax=Clunio marinus TaxID=568069 RepID=A0A1J1IJ38_9DIPT|nr:CLUMA_CG013526, isoform A [Clunio marinus]CRL00258.1 CLUMA_CG013531, isoform A [Clunio marinus]
MLITLFNFSHLISIIADDAFNELTNLKYFDISFNQLVQMPNVSAMKKLISLYLHENSIEAVAKEDLSNNLDLKGIWLYNNNLKYIQASAFEQLHNVRFVDLTHNKCINMARIYYNPQPFYNAINAKCKRPNEDNEIEILF